MSKKARNIVGRKEFVSFPALGLDSVPAKIDTGAYGSSIHCSSVGVTNENTLRIVFSAEEYGLEEDSVVEFSEYRRKTVVSSSGHSEERFVVDTDIELGNEIREVSISLTNRERLRLPVLIGRLFLKKHHLLVNPRKTNAFSKGKKK